MNPEQWLAQYDETLKEAAANAEKTQKALRDIGGSATSPEGDITVRVDASGATVDLVLRPGVRSVEPEQLARLILRTTQEAQREVGSRVVETMREFVGEGDALEFVKSHLRGGYEGDGSKEPVLEHDTRADEDYFENPPEVIK